MNPFSSAPFPACSSEGRAQATSCTGRASLIQDVSTSDGTAASSFPPLACTAPAGDESRAWLPPSSGALDCPPFIPKPTGSQRPSEGPSLPHASWQFSKGPALASLPALAQGEHGIHEQLCHVCCASEPVEEGAGKSPPRAYPQRELRAEGLKDRDLSPTESSVQALSPWHLSV